MPKCGVSGVPPPSRRIVPLVRPAGRSPASHSGTTGLTTPGELSHGQTARLAAAPGLAGGAGCGDTVDCWEARPGTVMGDDRQEVFQLCLEME